MSKAIKRILVVDDLKSWQESIGGILEELDCMLDYAADAQEAKAKLQNENFDLCIVDIRLHENVEYNVGGINLLEWISKSQKKNLPVIILTGHGTEALKQKAEWYNAFAFIEKSIPKKDYDFDRDTFLKTVKNALEL